MGDLKLFAEKMKNEKQSDKMPALFIGHGNPMNAIENNKFSKEWKKLGKSLPKPAAILCISAHWETAGTKVTAMNQPRTIHDFGGFPQELFNQQYPAPGAIKYAEMTIAEIKTVHIQPDQEWGLDHGTWSILLPMYPEADIPVYQLSLDWNLSPEKHFELARELAFLRTKGVLIIGSGNMVHNLRMMRMNSEPYDWAKEFDEKLKYLIENNDTTPIVNYNSLGSGARLAIPTNEHYLPLIYTLALRDNVDELTFFNEDFDLASVSMRSFILM